jgi:hypothetical protein
MSFDSMRKARKSIPMQNRYFRNLQIIEILYSIMSAGGRPVRDFVVEMAAGCRYLTSLVFDPFGEKIGSRGAVVEAWGDPRRHYKNLLAQELRGLT